MPIKLPKGFSRRKSSGNGLEEITNPPEQSFRVFERPNGRSFDGATTVKRSAQGRPSSEDENIFAGTKVDPNLSNRGSGGTNNSSSSGGLYDTSSSSARFSSSSTLPSSADATPDENLSVVSKALPSIPIPPIPDHQPAFSLRAASRKFSIGRKSVPASPNPGSGPRPDNANIISQNDGYAAPNENAYYTPRARAFTESSYASASTATPPKLLDTDLDFGKSDLDGFGDMFESYGKRRSRVLEEESFGLRVASPDNMPSEAHFEPEGSASGRSFLYQPALAHRDGDYDANLSPYSLGSRQSQDGLISSSPMVDERSRYTDDSPVPRQVQGVAPSVPSPVLRAASPSARPRPQRPISSVGAGLRRQSALISRRSSTPLEDEDARLVMDSVNASRRLNRRSGAFSLSPVRPINGTYGAGKEQKPALGTSSKDPFHAGQGRDETDPQAGNCLQNPVALFDSEDPDLSSSNSWRQESTDTTPRQKKLGIVNPEQQSLFDPSHPAAKIAAKRRDGEFSAVRQGQTKVMTPAQFEQYRKDQDSSYNTNGTAKDRDSDNGSEDGEDEDEAERTRQLARQRRKQEAHLAVYRQQMMKVTGEQPSNLPESGQSRSVLEKAISHPQRPEGSGKVSDDEDENIPLGILAAHGFPAKNRPPGLMSSGSVPNIRYTSETYPPPPASVAGGSVVGGPRSSLPPFARNLPQDPYFGASLVNPSNREPLAFGNKATGSVYGGAHPSMAPGGLVGVIAGEERARAMRRGSPNAQGTYGPPMPAIGMQHMPTAMAPGMSFTPPGMSPMPMISAGEEAQIQMSQQMTQMMQMQMEWMQSMMALQQGLSPGQQLQPGQAPLPISLQNPPAIHIGPMAQGQMQRPTSMAFNSAPVTPQEQRRTMSMLDPSMAHQWSQQGNRASVAPSMMSGALGTQIYAPSLAPSERSNIGMPARYRPVSISPADEYPPKNLRALTLTVGSLQGYDEKGANSSVRLIDPIKKKLDDEEDEEDGWELMKIKREKKKSTWKHKKMNERGNMGDVYYPES